MTAAAMARYRSRQARGAKIIQVEISEPMLGFLIDGKFLDVDHVDDKAAVAAAVEQLHAVLTKSDRITQRVRRP